MDSKEFEMPRSGQMRMPPEIWQYCHETAQRCGFKNANEAAKRIIEAHRGWMAMKSESKNPHVY